MYIAQEREKKGLLLFKWGLVLHNSPKKGGGKAFRLQISSQEKYFCKSHFFVKCHEKQYIFL